MAEGERITIKEARARLLAQGVRNRDMATICPVCGTVQSMASLVRAGAPKEKVENYFGFSCEGRFSDAGPWPRDKDKSAKAKARRAVRGCDWTLGGLFTIHRLTIVYEDDTEKPSFEIATPEQAAALCAEMIAGEVAHG